VFLVGFLGWFVQGNSSFFGFGSLLCKGGVLGSLDVCSQLGLLRSEIVLCQGE
jgi:hypothetical protein